MANILITGGTGSLGSALVEHWYPDHHLTIISRDSHKQAALRYKYPDLTFFQTDIGDQKNFELLAMACEDQDILIHTAALKVVSEGQYHPHEFSRVNIDGSLNIARAWYRTGKGRPAIGISSDKAKSALNTYGASKKIMESIFRYYDFSVLCYGNVVTSNGSFLHVWKRQVEEGKPITVVKPDSTRFFLTMPDAIALIEDCLEVRKQFGDGIYVPHSLPTFSVWDTATAFCKAHQMDVLEDIDYIPIGGYEKRHEILVSPGEGVDTASNLLSRIWVPYWPDDDSYRDDFCSDRSERRMRGSEVLESLK